MKILIVDDNSRYQNTLKKILQQGIPVCDYIFGNNGIEAIKQFQLHRPDFVVMDFLMPELDGIAASKEIVKLDPSASVIIVSQLKQEDFSSDALKAGAAAAFSKTEINELITFIRQNSPS